MKTQQINQNFRKNEKNKEKLIECFQKQQFLNVNNHVYRGLPYENQNFSTIYGCDQMNYAMMPNNFNNNNINNNGFYPNMGAWHQNFLTNYQNNRNPLDFYNQFANMKIATPSNLNYNTNVVNNNENPIDNENLILNKNGYRNLNENDNKGNNNNWNNNCNKAKNFYNKSKYSKSKP